MERRDELSSSERTPTVMNRVSFPDECNVDDLGEYEDTAVGVHLSVPRHKGVGSENVPPIVGQGENACVGAG